MARDSAIVAAVFVSVAIMFCVFIITKKTPMGGVLDEVFSWISVGTEPIRPLLFWFLATLIGGTCGMVVTKSVLSIAGGLGANLDDIEYFLLSYTAAFAGLIGQGIVNGLRGKGYKVRLE